MTQLDTDSLGYKVVFDSFSTGLIQLTKESLFGAQQLYTKIAGATSRSLS